MARLLRTQSLGTTVTRQDLYDLIHTSALTDIGVTVVGVSSIVASTNAPGFTTSIWWFDQEKQLLRVPICSVGGSACSLWLSVGPDSLETPVYNASANVYPRGAIVSFAPGDGIYNIELTAARNHTSTTYGAIVRESRLNRNLRNALGVLQATLSQGQWGCAVVRGVCYARMLSTTAAASGNLNERMMLSTQYTAAFYNHQQQIYTQPFEVGLTLARVSAAYSVPWCMPAWVWFPFNSVSGPYDTQNVFV